MEISDINTKNIYIEICYCSPINSSFYTKKYLDKKCSYKILEKGIYNMKSKGIILLLGDFNAITTTNKDIISSNDSNPNPLWLYEDIFLANRYIRNF
jgi:hypothetical protein